MPTKDDPRITVRLDQALYDDLRREADEKGLKLGAYVKRVLNLRNGTPITIEASVVDEAFRKIPGNGPTVMGPASLHCPMPGCHFAAKSAAAKCPTHGRTVR